MYHGQDESFFMVLEYSSTRVLEYADALFRQQGYMLAQIVAEIHAPDLAVGDVGGTGVAVSGYDEDHLFGSAHHHAEDADLFS